MEYYSNNYSKYIEQLKLEKSQKAFKDLVESTKEVKPNKIIVDNIPSEKDGDKVYYENKDFSSTSSKSVSIEDNKSSYSAPNKIEHDMDLPNSSEYSSIQKYHELKESSKSNDKIDHDTVYSDKSGKEVEVDNTVLDKDSAELRFNNEISDKSDSNIELENLPSEKTDSDLNKEVITSNKNGEELSLDNDPSDKLSISLDKDVSLSDKDLVSLNKDIETSNKNTNDISKEYAASIKTDNNISKEYITSEKSSSDIIALIKEEKKAAKELTAASTFGNKNNSELKILIANPNKNEAVNLNKDYLYFAYDSKEYESSTYKKYAKELSYYPAGSYSSINALQNESIENIFNSIINPSNWSTEGKNLVNSIKVTSDVLDMVNLAGKSENIYIPGTTSNNLRMNLKLDEEQLNLGSKSFKSIDNQTEQYKNSELSLNEKEVEILYKDPDTNEEYQNAADNNFTNEKTEIEVSYRDPTLGDIVLNPFKKDSLGKKSGPEIQFKYNSSGFVYDANLIEPERWYDRYNAIGKIYVIPPYKELISGDNGSDVAFTIPLQNNLKFETISRAAAWNAIQFFGRIGDVQQYSRTGSLDAISISTQYFVDDDPKNPFTMSNLQNIEMMYRSLVLPGERKSKYIEGDNSTNNTFYYFTRPPVINIVLGYDETKEGDIPRVGESESSRIISSKEVYNNLFTDIITSYSNDGNASNQFTPRSKIYYKNFIVTNVSIDKNQNDYNYYVEPINERENRYTYKDMMGFTVTLNIMEIDENYLNSTPSFSNYYNTLSARGITS